jgi:hypothetical protein
LEIEARSRSWVDPKGETLGPGEACLAAPAGKPFTLTLSNDPKEKDVLPNNHNISIRPSAGADALFTGSSVDPGDSVTYDVDPLAANVYLFVCDFHPSTMTGVLVVE